ncbi:MAG TPA: hypothetical protein VLX61_15935 [Anaerolineales bacterium]|nr:hypothetical protein [Anaerolineales bacterium]
MEAGWRTFPWAFKKSWNNVFRYGSYLAIFKFLTLAGGIGIWMIRHSLRIGGLRLADYWKPARSWLIKLLKIQDERWRQTPVITWYRGISLLLYLSIAFLFLFFGVKILLENGFLNQNLIYLIFFKPK